MLIRLGKAADNDAVFAFTNALSLHGGVSRAIFDPVFEAALGTANTVLLIA